MFSNYSDGQIWFWRIQASLNCEQSYGKRGFKCVENDDCIAGDIIPLRPDASANCNFIRQ